MNGYERTMIPQSDFFFQERERENGFFSFTPSNSEGGYLFIFMTPILEVSMEENCFCRREKQAKSFGIIQRISQAQI